MKYEEEICWKIAHALGEEHANSMIGSNPTLKDGKLSIQASPWFQLPKAIQPWKPCIKLESKVLDENKRENPELSRD